MDSFLELAEKRQSERAYLDKPVEKEKIIRCIEAARIAPSACNAQPWKFIVVDDQDIKEEISNNMSNRVLPLNHFTRQAPVHVVIVEEKMNFTSKFGATVKHKHFPFIDIGIAAEHFCLQAVSEGLGTCLLGWFNEPAVKKLLNIPKNKRVPLIITLGYPAKELRQKIRKEISEIHSFNTYE